jgi:hypothetical protein
VNAVILSCTVMGFDRRRSRRSRRRRGRRRRGKERKTKV